MSKKPLYLVERPPHFTDPNGFGVEVCGDSMVPKYERGQVVMVDTRQRPMSGDFAVVGLATGERYIKRYREHSGRIILESVNPLYPAIVVDPGQILFAHLILWARERRGQSGDRTSRPLGNEGENPPRPNATPRTASAPADVPKGTTKKPKEVKGAPRSLSLVSNQAKPKRRTERPLPATKTPDPEEGA